MTEPDIVAELDWLIDQYGQHHEGRIGQRARDEIVALRGDAKLLRKERDELGSWVDRIKHHAAAARAEALEEAARMCEADADLFDAQVANAMEACASAVRALKDAP